MNEVRTDLRQTIYLYFELWTCIRHFKFVGPRFGITDLKYSIFHEYSFEPNYSISKEIFVKIVGPLRVLVEPIFIELFAYYGIPLKRVVLVVFNDHLSSVLVGWNFIFNLFVEVREAHAAYTLVSCWHSLVFGELKSISYVALRFKFRCCLFQRTREVRILFEDFIIIAVVIKGFVWFFYFAFFTLFNPLVFVFKFHFIYFDIYFCFLLTRLKLKCIPLCDTTRQVCYRKWLYRVRGRISRVFYYAGNPIFCESHHEADLIFEFD